MLVPLALMLGCSQDQPRKAGSPAITTKKGNTDLEGTWEGQAAGSQLDAMTKSLLSGLAKPRLRIGKDGKYSLTLSASILGQATARENQVELRIQKFHGATGAYIPAKAKEDPLDLFSGATLNAQITPEGTLTLDTNGAVKATLVFTKMAEFKSGPKTVTPSEELVVGTYLAVMDSKTGEPMPTLILGIDNRFRFDMVLMILDGKWTLDKTHVVLSSDGTGPGEMRLKVDKNGELFENLPSGYGLPYRLRKSNEGS